MKFSLSNNQFLRLTRLRISNLILSIMIILILPLFFYFHDSKSSLIQFDILDSNLITSKKVKPVKVEVLFNTYNEYNMLNINKLELTYKNELTMNGFEVVKEKGESVDITMNFGIIVKYDGECDKYYSVYLLKATEFTGFKFDYVSGPHLNIFSSIDEVMHWLEDNFIANVNTMKRLYIGG